MDFREVSQISALLARDYAEDFLRLLVKYQSISASGSGNSINTVSIFTGKGRNREERRINLTSSQGKTM